MASGDDIDCARAYSNAAKTYGKVSVVDAARCLKKCIAMYLDQGRFGIAAKAEKDLAELYEAENNFTNAIEHYENSADYYDGDGSKGSGNSILLKVAQLSAEIGDYAKASDIYDNVAKESVKNKLTKYSVPGYLMNASLFKLALGDVVDTNKSLERYETLSLEFSNSREITLLRELVESVDSCDIERFTAAVQKYDSISRLDILQTKALLKIKDSIKDEDDDLA